jgi:hypothetical protein
VILQAATGSGCQPAMVRARQPLGIVGDAWEHVLDLCVGRQFALLLIGGADRGGGFLGNDEHAGGVQPAAGGTHGPIPEKRAGTILVT